MKICFAPYHVHKFCIEPFLGHSPTISLVKAFFANLFLRSCFGEQFFLNKQGVHASVNLCVLIYREWPVMVKGESITR